MPRRPRAAANASADGNGWRPSDGSPGPERSRSRSTKTAPGMCACSKASRPERPSRYQRTSATTTSERWARTHSLPTIGGSSTGPGRYRRPLRRRCRPSGEARGLVERGAEVGHLPEPGHPDRVDRAPGLRRVPMVGEQGVTFSGRPDPQPLGDLGEQDEIDAAHGRVARMGGVVPLGSGVTAGRYRRRRLGRRGGASSCPTSTARRLAARGSRRPSGDPLPEPSSVLRRSLSKSFIRLPRACRAAATGIRASERRTGYIVPGHDSDWSSPAGTSPSPGRFARDQRVGGADPSDRSGAAARCSASASTARSGRPSAAAAAAASSYSAFTRPGAA